MGSEVGDNFDHSFQGLRYLIVRPENGGIRDLLWFLVSADKASVAKFLDSSDELAVKEFLGDGVGGVVPHRRWIIFMSILIRKLLARSAKSLAWTGNSVEFFLNLLSNNGNLSGLIYNLLHGKVVIPCRGSETYLSIVAQVDGRVDLYKRNSLVEGACEPAASGSSSGRRALRVEIENRALMDLCIMASKLAYENANVVRNVVNNHWKMHFVDFYDCWNDYLKKRSTQVFILCDKPKDADLILISFRGTEPPNADDWITDFDYSWYEIPNVGKVHMGFLEALGLGNRADTSTFQNLLPRATDTNFTSLNGEKTLIPEREEEMTAYFSVGTKVKSLLNEHQRAKFVVTGHSLGGALAILFPTMLVVHEETELMKRMLGVCTFGQPRIGNNQLGWIMGARFNHPIPKYLRVVYCNDMVPRVPYDDKTFLYKHFGECLYYNSLYIGQELDEEPNKNYFGVKYIIPVHLTAVWELIRSFIAGYISGPEYKEGWLSVLVRVAGLAAPGISAHNPANYINSIRLGMYCNTA